jgi:hypothetical protein
MKTPQARTSPDGRNASPFANAMADKTTPARQSGRKMRRQFGNAAKTLRCQKGRFYDQKKVRKKKVKIALRLRRETMMTLAWIAGRLQMGTKAHLAHLLNWHGRKMQ